MQKKNLKSTFSFFLIVQVCIFHELFAIIVTAAICEKANIIWSWWPPGTLGMWDSKMRRNQQGAVSRVGGFTVPNKLRFPWFCRQACVWLQECSGHVSQRFLRHIHSKVTINRAKHCLGRSSNSPMLVCKSPTSLGMKETSIHSLSAMTG